MLSTNLSAAIFIVLILTTAGAVGFLPSTHGCANTIPTQPTLNAIIGDGVSQVAESPAVGKLQSGQADAGSGVIGRSLYLVGGYGETVKDPLNSVSIYSLDTNRWEAGPAYPTKAWGTACTSIGTSLYCFGGRGAGSRAFRLIAGSSSWSGLADMPAVYNDSEGHVAVADPQTNTIYILGSSNIIPAQKITLAYDVKSDSYARLRDMPIGNGWFASGLLDGKIYTIGGIHSAGVFVYDISGDSWSTTGSCLPGPPRYGMIRDPRVFSGLIPVVDGRTPGSGFYHDILFYDPANDLFVSGPSTLLPRDGVGGGIIGDYLLVVGGRNDIGAPYGLRVSEEMNLTMSS